MMQRPRDRLALDRASVRSVDSDGHLHVAMSNICKASISPYFGSEIPDAQRHGLRPGQTYNLLRDPAELARAAPSFAGKPILMVHQPVSAADHPHGITVGAVGGPIKFDAPYLKGGLTFWDSKAIMAIDSGAQSELSPGYYYDLDPTPGTYQGQPYFGRMVNIRFNHLAIVPEGRQGPDVMVGDAALSHDIARQFPGLSHRNLLIVTDALRRHSMATDNDNSTTKALVALVSYLQTVVPGEGLDEVSMMLDGGVDPATGAATPAMDRIAKRRAAKGRTALDQRYAAGYAERFPNATRLLR